MTVTGKIEVGISSNLLHSISTSICIRKCNKNGGSIFGHFLDEIMGYSTVMFQMLFIIGEVRCYAGKGERVIRRKNGRILRHQSKN